MQAAESAFTMNFSRELARDLPGSKTILVHPGGMKTDLFKGTNTDTSNFMEPNVVAEIIWDEVESQRSPFKELQIMRNDDGSPSVSYDPRIPELPFADLVVPDDVKKMGILSKEQAKAAQKFFSFED